MSNNTESNQTELTKADAPIRADNIDPNATSNIDELTEEDKEILNKNLAQFLNISTTILTTNKGNEDKLMTELTESSKSDESTIVKPTIDSIANPITNLAELVKPSKQEYYTVYMGTLVPKEKLREFIDALFIEITAGNNDSDEDNNVELAPNEDSRFICHPGVSINQELYNLYYKDAPINMFDIKKDKLYECMSLENLDTSNLTPDDILKLKSIPLVLLNNEYCVERIPCGVYAGDFMITLLKIDLERHSPCSKFYIYDKHILSNINPFIKSLAELGLVGKYKFAMGYSITAQPLVKNK